MRRQAVVRAGATLQLKDEDEGTGTQKHKKCIVKMGGSVV
jgi:hypothetical protein